MFLLQFSKTKRTPKLEIFLNDLATLRKYSEVEVTVSYYPYGRGIKADHFHFDPYEDYIFDLTEGKRSTYQQLPSFAAQAFGIMVGGLIFLYFGLFFPHLLLSVESVVSIFAAYTIGKEIWGDVDRILQNVTSGRAIRWLQQEFFYVLQEFGTLQRFWQLARKKRYGYQLTLPKKIDLISHSNSKTVEMLFTSKQFRQLDLQQVRVLSINFTTPYSLEELPKVGLVITRIAVVKKRAGFKFITEWYQSFDGRQIGSLDSHNKWRAGHSLQKSIVSWGRGWWLWRKPLMVSKQLITMNK